MTIFTLRMEDSLKSELDEFCEKMGMNLTTFFMMYVKKTLRDQKIPFELGLNNSCDNGTTAFNKLREQARNNGLQDWTLDDINAEIAAARQAR